MESQVPAACKPGTKRCICETLAALYARGELTLRAGKVQRRALAQRARRNETVAPKGCRQTSLRGAWAVHRPVSTNFLKEQGHARLWIERLPAIRERLEQYKESGTLPTTNQGKLNRSAVLREFAPDQQIHP